MASIGNLTATLGLDTRQLNAGAAAAARRLGQLNTSMRAGINTAGKYGAAMAAAGVALGGAFVNHALSAGREIQNLSRITNTSVEEFQRLAYAARTVGVESDKLADIYKDVQDKVGDFIQTGAGPMADFFEQIAPRVGVTAQQFRSLSGPQALQLYVDSLEKANLSQSDMTFYMAAIASDATNLLPLLRSSGQGMRNLGDEAERAGLILSDFDVQALVEARQTVDQLMTTMSALGTQIVADLAPYIQVIGKEFLESASDAGDFSSMTTDGLSSVVDAIGKTADVLRGIQVSFKGATWVAQSFGTGVLSSFSYIQEAAAEMDAWIVDLRKSFADLYNTVPMLPDIDTSGLEESAKSFRRNAQEMREWRAEMQRSTTQTFDELQTMLAQPMPSQGIDEWWRNVQTKVEQVRQQAQAALAADGSGGGNTASGAVSTKKTAKTVQTVDTTALDEARLTLQRMQKNGDVDVEFDVDADALEGAADYVDYMETAGVDLGAVGIDASEVSALQNQLRAVANQRIGEKEVRVNATQLDAARVALGDLAGDDEIIARVGVDSSEVKFVQGLLDHMAAMQFDPKAMQIGTADALRASSVLRKLQDVKLDKYGIEMDAEQLKSAVALFSGLSAGKIPKKTAEVDSSQYDAMIEKLIRYQGLLKNVEQPEQLQSVASMARQREQEAEQRREMLNTRVEQLSQTLMTERQLEQQQHEQRIEDLQAFKELEAANVAKGNALIEKENARHEKEKQKLQQQSTSWMLADQRQFMDIGTRLEKANWQTRAGIITSALADITATNANQSKAMFEVNKIAGSAQATISTLVAANEALKAGPIIGPILAAAITAQGMARVAAINSQSYGSGGGAAPSVAANSPATPVTPVGGDSSGGGSKTLNINLTGGSAEQRQSLRQIMDGMNEALNDGYKFDRIKMVDN